MKYANQKDLITAVRAYAKRHYEQDGFDLLAECWNDVDIASEIGNARTLSGALRKLHLTPPPAPRTAPQRREDMMYQVFTQTEGANPELVFSSDYDDEVISYVQEHCVDTFDLPDWPAADGEVLAAGNTSEDDGCPIMWAEGRFPNGWKAGVRFAGEQEACNGDGYGDEYTTEGGPA